MLVEPILMVETIHTPLVIRGRRGSWHALVRIEAIRMRRKRLLHSLIVPWLGRDHPRRLNDRPIGSIVGFVGRFSTAAHGGSSSKSCAVSCHTHAPSERRLARARGARC